jgi:16S rRNA (cytidine1402-2'-O)-methyltransferase
MIRLRMAGTLFVVATPLGNLEDVTLRALRVLREVDLVACEDTRRTAKLLQHNGIATPTTSYYEHNERWKGERILKQLRDGKDIALVSDAGTPGISDPGFRLVRDARAAGLSVVPVPGPSAGIAALSVSGLPTDRFLFVGFLPARRSPRRRAIARLASVPDTLVIYETPARVAETLSDLLSQLGDRPAFLCREATKLHEEYRLASLAVLLEELGARGRVRGEIVLVVAGAPPGADQQSPRKVFEALVAQGLTRREAVKQTARRLGRHARDVYREVLDGDGHDAEGILDKKSTHVPDCAHAQRRRKS